MCEICDGTTWGEVLLRKHLAIEDKGWTYAAVEGAAGGSCWTHTVGLTTSFNHPELVVTGVIPEEAAALLEVLCLRIKDGDRLAPGTDESIDGTIVQLLDVHPAQREPALASWVRYYESLGGPRPPLRALQVVVPADWFCDCHVDPQPLMDKPRPILGWEGTNRAQRRARTRTKASDRYRPRRW